MAQPLSDQTGIDQHIAYVDIGKHTVIGVALLFAGLQADVLAQHQPFVIALPLLRAFWGRFFAECRRASSFPRKRESSHDGEPRSPGPWMPACAGMTAERI